MDNVTSQWHVQPSEFDKMQFWRIQEMFDNFKDQMEKTSEHGEDAANDKQTSSMISKTKARLFGSDNFNLKGMFNKVKLPKL